MPIRGPRRPGATAALLFLLVAVVAQQAQALPTLLNYVPAVDLVPERTVVVQLQHYAFHFREAATRATVKETSSLLYVLEVGLARAEIGFDVVADKGFSNTDSGLYAGPVAVNAKYRLLNQGQGRDRFSLAVGCYNLCATRYDLNGADVGYYAPSPYLVAARSFPGFRLHLGYQWNILGYRRLDSDRRRNNDVIAGFDAVIVRHKTRPLSLLVDYAGGPARMVAFGLGQTLGPNWAVGVSVYQPIDGHLPASGLELPRQTWVGVSHFLKF